MLVQVAPTEDEKQAPDFELSLRSGEERPSGEQALGAGKNFLEEGSAPC
jgi:hypothetical protein